MLIQPAVCLAGLLAALLVALIVLSQIVILSL
jgi:hypothetical protein